jgi:hypothetical protein
MGPTLDQDKNIGPILDQYWSNVVATRDIVLVP